MGIQEIRDGAIQYRAAVVEDVDVTKGEMFLKAIPYSHPTDIGAGIIEEFLPGTFAKAALSPTHLRLKRGHDGRDIGHGVTVEDRPAGVWARLRLGRSQDAKDALLDYEDGIARDPSIEFRVHPQTVKIVPTENGYRVTHKRAHLAAVALVPEGAYRGSAFVESVREADRERAIEEALGWFQLIRSTDPFVT